MNKPWNELEIAVDRTLSQVIPRLLGALESAGRSIKPCLIHGDLWEGNIGTEYETGNIFIFDAAPYYAHNEMELAIWSTEHHRMKNKVYKREYLRNFQPSEPSDEFDDRNRLYSVKTQLMYSAHVPGTNVRIQSVATSPFADVTVCLTGRRAYEDLRYLIDKFAPAAEENPGK